MRRLSTLIVAIAVVAVLLALAGGMNWLDLNKTVESVKKAKVEPTPVPKPAAVDLDIITATKEVPLNIRFMGNGREELKLLAENTTDREVRSEVPAGMLFTTADGAVQMVVVQSIKFSLLPGEKPEVSLRAAAIRLTNPLAENQFYPSETRLDPINEFLPTLSQFPDATNETIQTALLILLHDAPLPVFSKFKLVKNELSDNPAPSGMFKVNVPDLLMALLLLKDLAIAPQPPQIALSQQVKLEAMINPKAHDLALKYFDIDRDAEWDFWKTELTNGDPSTRHYALYGIARFYPDIAFKMLPSWITQTRTPTAYRVHAAYALAEVENDEVLRKLSELQAQLASEPEVAKAITVAVGIAQKKAVDRSRPPATTTRPADL